MQARTLLATVPEPAEVLAEMVRLAKPGGWVASLEPDAECALCHPAHPAYTRMWELFRAAFSRHGADLLIGRRLDELYRHAGLQEIGVEARAGVYRAGDSPRMVGPDLVRSIHPVIVSLGLADQEELDALDRAVRSHLDDPRTLVMPHLSFLIWGPQATRSAAMSTLKAAGPLTVMRSEPAISRVRLNAGRTNTSRAESAISHVSPTTEVTHFPAGCDVG